MRYTSDQFKAINHKEGNLQIIACAGSGKTDVVSRRIALLVKDGVKPENILAFTFTEKAAEELKFRIRRHLEKLCPEHSEIGEMYIGTIHSFCFELLKDFKPEYKNFDVLDEHKRILFLSDYSTYYRLRLHDLNKGNTGVDYGIVRKFIRSVDVLRDEMIGLADLPDDEFKESYNRYDSLLKEERLLDFSCMMSNVVDLLENDAGFYAKAREKFKFVVVDEYQDINPLQEKLINLICGESGNLCVVGDDDQSIYQWRGTNVDNILTFTMRYSGVENVSLVENFRSTEGIINSASRLIQENSSRLEKEMLPYGSRTLNYQEGDIYKVFFEDMENEVDFIVKKIGDLRGTLFRNNKGEEFSLDYRDMAILLRSVRTSVKHTKVNEQRQTLTEVLDEHDIPYIIQGGGQLFDSPEVTLAVATLAYVAGYDYNGLRELDELEDLYTRVFDDRGDVDSFIEKVENHRQSLDPDSWISLQGELQLILTFIGITDFDFTEVQLYNVGMLSQVISDFELVRKKIKTKAFKYFLGYIRAYAEAQYEEGGNDDPTLVNAVKIMTIHRAKGLEFPVVFMSNLVDGRFPTRSLPFDVWIPDDLFERSRYEGGLEDERRLFYVAVTRSQKYLFLTGARKIPSLITEKRPSVFFDEFPEDYALTEPIDDPTEREEASIEMEEPLRNFPTSYSDLRYYDRCPYNYKLRFIYGFNPGVDMALGYGRNVHNILNMIHKDYKERVPTGDEIEDIIYKNFYMRYAPEAYQERFKKSVMKLINKYVGRYGGDFNLVLETEKPFEFSIGNGLISGSIDLIKKLDKKGNVEGIEIVDFKNKEDKEFATDYEKQLKLYAIASLRSLGLNPKKATVHHLDDGKLSEVDISSVELNRVENEIKDEIDKITDRHFPKNPEGKKCRNCDFKLICNKKNGC